MSVQAYSKKTSIKNKDQKKQYLMIEQLVHKRSNDR